MTMECLFSLKKIGYPNYEIVLVDNASEDDSVAAVRENFPEVAIIENKRNLGVAGGRNVGIKHGLERGMDYLLLLDNDTIVHKDFITEMVKVGEENDRAGILTAKIYFYSRRDKIWSAGCHSSLVRGKYTLIGYEEVDKGQYDETKEVDQAPGCCLMIKKEVIDKIGILDEKFVQYFGEDVDWCLRAKKRGYKIMYVPKATLWHHVIKKTSVSDRYWYLKGRNVMLLRRKHHRLHHWFLFSFFFVVGSVKAFYREVRAGNLRQFLIMVKGVLDAFKVKKRG
jgi:hypothetical protein